MFFYNYNYVSILGEIGSSDLQIFYQGLLPGCILAVGIGIVGIAIVMFCLKKDTLLLLLPLVLGTVLMTILLYNVYVNCSLNAFSNDPPMLYAQLKVLFAVTMLSGFSYWGLVIYKVKRPPKMVGHKIQRYGNSFSR